MREGTFVASVSLTKGEARSRSSIERNLRDSKRVVNIRINRINRGGERKRVLTKDKSKV